jgi:two-component system chemotaxis sensor kinase CheA
MPEIVEHVPLNQMTDLIDELSTRLILDGVAALAGTDFDRLSCAAAGFGLTQITIVAQRITQAFVSASTPLPDLTRLVSSGLVEMRKLLDEPVPSPHASESVSFAREPQLPNTIRTADMAEDRLAADEELVREFVNESTEHLENIENQLLILENDASAAEVLNSIFRGFHTIKGLAGFLAFAEIQGLTHEIETLLEFARAGQLTVNAAIVDILLESTDIVRQELARIVQRLAGRIPGPTLVSAALLDGIRHAACVASASRKPPAASLESPGAVDSGAIPLLETPQRQPCSGETQAACADDGAMPRSKHEERRTSDTSSVRVETAKLDQLMDMVGEMVIVQTLLQHSTAIISAKNSTLQRNFMQLARITADVQRITTSMRMVPIGLQFNKTARVVRDLARRTDKQIIFESSGNDTELDKTIAEQLSDPLLHMVRNSIDHGIESPEERTAQGKPLIAHIRVSARHQAGQIMVTVSDDGRGLDRNKILARARQTGLVAPGVQLPDSELFLLIFEPGFSTAAKVSDISGRGVGMDVVRRQVQKLCGRIDIQSETGKGTTFSIQLPLTLAIIEGFVAAVGQQRYIIPIIAVREIFRPSPEMLSTVQQTAEMALVRGGLLPIVRLHRRFAIEPRSSCLTEGTLVVTESEGRPFCLFVDDLIGKQEVVIKSLGRSFKDTAGVAGCAILGDGRVGLILDVDGIFKWRP